MRLRGLYAVALFLCVLALALPAAAQETRGAIEGTITDASGAVLPGVTVEARGAAGGVFTSVTDERGAYRFPALQPGAYEVSASLEGFTPAKRTANLVVGQLLKVDIPLAVAGVSETVQVTGEAPTIDVKQATAATNIQAAEIDKLPKGRNFADLVTLAPGANDESRSGGISVDGASAAENKYYLDGVDTTNLQTGVSATTVLPDFIQEVQVKSSGYSAEFGGATGGVISVISKSGTNMFRGDLGGYLNTDGMNGDS
ncbi:MAG: TonB-dependent receptor, partial [Acidobacteria bacterium]|nr:TonB-dependent receptor [Acidobacteriota bacterium]